MQFCAAASTVEFLSFTFSQMRMFHTPPKKHFHNYWTKRCCLLPRVSRWCTIFQLMHHANLIQIYNNTLSVHTSVEQWKWIRQQCTWKIKTPQTVAASKLRINETKSNKNAQKIEKNCFVNWLPHTLNSQLECRLRTIKIHDDFLLLCFRCILCFCFSCPI